MKVYFAHPKSEYRTTFKRFALVRIAEEMAGHEIVDPSCFAAQVAAKFGGIGYFEQMAVLCDKLVFVAFEDGMVGAGVAAEIDAYLGPRLHDVPPPEVCFEMKRDFSMRTVTRADWQRRRENGVLSIEATGERIKAAAEGRT